MRPNLLAWWLIGVEETSFARGFRRALTARGEEATYRRPPKVNRLLGLVRAVQMACRFALVDFIRFEGWRVRSPSITSISSGDLLVVDYIVSPSDIITFPASPNVRYWGPLGKLLNSSSWKLTSVHIFASSNFRSYKTARRVVAQANRKTPHHNQILLQSLTSLSLYGKTLRDYIRLRLAGLFIFSDAHQSRTVRNMWQIGHGFCSRTLCGSGAFQAVFLMNLFENFLSRIPHQPLGLYLQEGRPWEYAFIAAWRRFGHGTLIGVPHTTIRYWDLPYARDPRTYRQSGNSAMPRPDFVAVNGPQSKLQMLKDGYPEDEIIEVEALRYMYLAHLNDRTAPNTPSDRVQVLLLGEYDKELTAALIRIVTEARPLFTDQLTLRIRPHPAAPRDSAFAEARIDVIRDKGIGEAIEQADLVIAMSTTNAVLDSYCAGVPTIVVEDPNTLNSSPLLGRDDVHFVKTAEQLASVIRQLIETPPQRQLRAEDFFYLDPELPRWRKLLGLS